MFCDEPQANKQLSAGVNEAEDLYKDTSIRTNGTKLKRFIFLEKLNLKPKLAHK